MTKKQKTSVSCDDEVIDVVEEVVGDTNFGTENSPDEGAEAEVESCATGSDVKSVEQLEAENRDIQDRLLRLAAEFENYKKRMVRDKQSALKYAEEGVLKDMLPTLDNLERALHLEEGTNDVKTLIEGVELTLKALQTTLAKYGLEAIESVGQPFDPNLHEALVMEASDEVPAQSVIRAFEKGYNYKDRLLRAAKVVVSKGTE